jgi:hypothetical protein
VISVSIASLIIGGIEVFPLSAGAVPAERSHRRFAGGGRVAAAAR